MRKTTSGFTIVELLIVIVVIAILAAIAITAYTGVQNKARVSAVSSALSQASKKLATYAVENTGYPTDLASIGITNTGGVSYEYSVNNAANPATYCITATTGPTSYKVSSASTLPVSGGCAGHGVGGVAAITNLHTNPSVETNTSGYAGANGTTVTRSTAAALVGSNGIRASSPANSIADSGVNLGVPAGTAGQTVTYSVRIRAQTADTYRFSLQGAQFVGTVASVPLADGQSTTFTYTHNITTSGAIALYILRSNSTAVVDFDIDGVMVTSGTTAYTYADGNSTDWTWNGTVNNSTSKGPAL
jgi:prepilin-type N-terminal cleavage/methylation domain-containing protein